MSRPLRYIPPGSVVEVTSRTVASRYLLRPGPTTNNLVLGVIGRAQHLYGVRIFALTVMSNHLHALLGVDHGAQLAGFMQHLLANIAKEVGRYHRWQGPFWARRYRAIVAADGESQVSRLKYVLCQGLKEGLIERVDRWPGVSTTVPLIRGTPLHGVWHDRTAQFKARPGGTRPGPNRTEQTYEIVLSQLPAFATHSREQYRALLRDMVHDEERDVAANRAQAGKVTVLGIRNILAQDPHSSPAESARSPAPLVHAASQAIRAAFRAAYAAFVDAYRSAAACLRAGATAEFPHGAFPPPAPFVAPPPITS